MNESCIKVKISSKLTRILFNVYSNQARMISSKQKYSIFLHTYCDADHARDLTDMRSVTSTSHLFNGTIVNWCFKKQTKTSLISSNTLIRATYTCVVDQNSIFVFRSIGYPIGAQSKLYEYNQATINQVLANRITPQTQHIDVLINSINEYHLEQTFATVDTRSTMKLNDLNSKPHGG